MGNFIDLTGQKFGRLTALELAGRDQKNRISWRCSCDCGNEKTLLGSLLRTGHATSCGCATVEYRKNFGARMLGHHVTHGLSRTPTQKSWEAMIERCTKPRHQAYARYGGRGITVCDRWRTSFSAFIEDMGVRPDGMCLDRVDPNGNYEKANCRWATMKEQAQNKRNNTFNAAAVMLIRHMARRGEKHADIAHAFGVGQSTITRIVNRKQWANL